MVSFGDSLNAPTSGVATMTVSGVSFANVDQTATVQVAVLCETASWASGTSAVCRVPPGLVGANKDVYVTASSGIGSRTIAFSFDGFAAALISTPRHGFLYPFLFCHFA